MKRNDAIHYLLDLFVASTFYVVNIQFYFQFLFDGYFALLKGLSFNLIEKNPLPKKKSKQENLSFS